MAYLLTGIRVIELAQVYAGPAAAMYLADQGADVIKIEPPSGDSSRQSFSFKGDGRWSRPFMALNRNKRSIVLDLAKPPAQEVAHRLVKSADVLIMNLRSRQAAGLRMDWETLKSINPRLIHTTITAFGDDGPDAAKPGYDPILQARSGMVSANRSRDGEPMPIPIMVNDMSCAVMTAYAVMLALWARRATGEGQKLSLSLLDMSVAMQAQQLVRLQGETSGIPARHFGGSTGAFPCSDGQHIMVVALSEPEWLKLCEALDLRHLAEDLALRSIDGRRIHADTVYPILEGVFSTRPRAEWLELLEAAGVPCGPVVDRNRVLDDPQLQANGTFIDHHHPAVGNLRMMGVPFKASWQTDRAGAVRRPAPDLGEHSVEVLQELGYDTATIEGLRRGGATQP